MIGQLLDGRYRIIRTLGKGGFGQTYIAEDTRRPGCPVCVVKHLKPASSDPRFLEIARRLFQSEAETLEKLGHYDRIPRLLAFFEHDSEFYLVQEYIDGHTLTHEIRRGQQWEEEKTIAMLKEVLSILAFVHSQGVIHRDIKPDNIIRRTSDNRLVLVDFGAVKQVRTQIMSMPEQTSATIAVGTPGYMSSEQGQGKPKPSSDIYALGMIGIQSLTGIAPARLDEDPETGEALWQHIAHVSPGSATVLSKMVKCYFRERYQSAQEVLEVLEKLDLENAVPETLIPAKPSTRIPTQSTPPRPLHPTRSDTPSWSRPIQSTPPRNRDGQPIPAIFPRDRNNQLLASVYSGKIPSRMKSTAVHPSFKPIVVQTVNTSGVSRVLVAICGGMVAIATTVGIFAGIRFGTPTSVTNSSAPIASPSIAGSPISGTSSSSIDPSMGVTSEIEHSAETGHMILAEAKAMADTGDYTKAIHIAGVIPSESMAYNQAQSAIAEWQLALGRQ
ncbi:MAG: serine/threonine protein kinase [Cyanobacteria bacterium CRU_2_1]|nr:serine/threonine protein kinase [Cyanobacteria bacterium CRU_2_1]